MQPDLQSILVTNIINDLNYSVGVQHRAWSDCTEVQADMGISWSLMMDFLFGEAYKFFHIEIRKDCCVKGKSAFKHAQNVQSQIILCMCKVSFGPLLSIHIFSSIQ